MAWVTAFVSISHCSLAEWHRSVWRVRLMANALIGSPWRWLLRPSGYPYWPTRHWWSVLLRPTMFGTLSPLVVAVCFHWFAMDDLGKFMGLPC